MEQCESRGINNFIKGTILILVLIIAMPANKPLADSYKKEMTYKQNTTTNFSEVLTKEYCNELVELEINKNLSNNSVNEFKAKLLDSLNIKINAYAVVISNEVFGYVANIDDIELIKGYIIQKYIDKIGLDSENERIENIAFVEKIELLASEIEYSKIDNYKNVAENIYSISIIDEDLLGIQITVNSKEEVEFEPVTIINETDELYIGNEEIVDGENGVKIVNKESVYSGVHRTDEMVLSEAVINIAQPIVINKGTKNPYYDGVVFLSSPTSGGYISALFGEPRNTSYHKGVDIAKNLGEDVTSALDGKVISAGYNNGGYGNLVIIEHEDNIQTYYAHLNEIYVSEGEVVTEGSCIGTIGSTGYSTGPHLHFELRVNGVPVDPLEYIK